MIASSSAASMLLGFDVRAFGRFLIESGDVSEHDWRMAGEVARQNAASPLRSLLDLGLLGEETLAVRLAESTGCARWAPDDETAPLSEALPVEFMRANAVLALDIASPAADVEAAPAMRLVCIDPSDHHLWRSVLGQVGGSAGAGIEIVFGAQKDINHYIAERAELAPAASGAGEDEIDVTAEISQLRDMASDAPVIRFFNQAVERAMDLGASDIHLERFDHRVSLRLRVDGVLIDQPAPPLRMYEALLCRIKIMSGLDIAERRLAQDGRIRMRLRGRMVDMRVSLVPTTYGQDAAIRLQDRARIGEITLEDLGFSAPHIESLVGAASKSHGIVLVTGPTGSGKTTTLYALLRRLITSELKVITVEDPVEYAMDGVNQIQVNPAINLTFGNTLRHVLRHDPDVILIGEIRDQETAEMAFQAALTGHMVLSTLHTNDVPGTFVRLIDMGVEPYLVNAAVEAVTAQRLLRRLCTQCRNDPATRESCRGCGGLGYRGRIAVMEYSGLTSEVKRSIMEGADERKLRETLVAGGYRDMRDHAMQLVADGITDEAEVVRAIGHPDAAEAADLEPRAVTIVSPGRRTAAARGADEGLESA
ncbi:MAG: type II/IV secretion system protein [Phycisphaeraceae bacterium]|nr:MAG: type II/IV secretion system protein [Phycisphaeraceae bacterium]